LTGLFEQTAAPPDNQKVMQGPDKPITIGGHPDGHPRGASHLLIARSVFSTIGRGRLMMRTRHSAGAVSDGPHSSQTGTLSGPP
jgi:hypothetical protein